MRIEERLHPLHQWQRRTVLARRPAAVAEPHPMLAGARAAEREHGAALPLMQGVKALFDPHGILNPGKMW